MSRPYDRIYAQRVELRNGAGDGVASRVLDYDAAEFRTNASYVRSVTDADIVFDFDVLGAICGPSQKGERIGG